jgi:ABC-type enterochelin transport system permease subunit
VHIPTRLSLGIVVGIIGLSILISVILGKRQHDKRKP